MATVGSFGIATVKREVNLKGTKKKLMKKNAVGLRRCYEKKGGAGNAISTIKANVQDGCGFAARRPYATNKSGQNATNLRDSYEESNYTTGGNAGQRESGGNTTENNVDGSGNATYYICGTYSQQATNLNPSVEDTNGNVAMPFMGKAINISNGNVTKNNNRLSGNAKTKKKNANESGNTPSVEDTANGNVAKPFMGKAINISNGNVTKNDDRLSGNAKTKKKNANESGNALMANDILPTRPYERAAGGTKNTMQVCYRCICEIVVYLIKKGVG